MKDPRRKMTQCIFTCVRARRNGGIMSIVRIFTTSYLTGLRNERPSVRWKNDRLKRSRQSEGA